MKDATQLLVHQVDVAETWSDKVLGMESYLEFPISDYIRGGAVSE
jgi:hypothetical protein